MFPRRVDGALLGGLVQLAGGKAARLKTVRARYRLDGLRLLVGDWRLNGRKPAGWVTYQLKSGAGVGGHEAHPDCANVAMSA